jgi:hypothetical protein
MPAPTRADWIKLRRILDQDDPPASMEVLYEAPPQSAAQRVADELLLDPEGTTTKVLLVGARGSGKSTELREVARLTATPYAVVEVDLDLSGVDANQVSAFDLLYVCTTKLLSLVPDQQARERLHSQLRQAYAPTPDDADRLGRFPDVVDGIKGFAELSASAAVALGLAAGAAPAIAAAAGAFGAGLQLVRSGLVSAGSDRGRSMQVAVHAAALAARNAAGRPPLVLVDGLERMNANALVRFREVFEDTRLLADAPWAAVLAAPPCTISETTAVDGRGYSVQPVWGFDPRETDGRTALRRLLERRAEAAGLGDHVDPAALDLIVALSGGSPRSAIHIARRAVEELVTRKHKRLDVAMAEEAARSVAVNLALGLSADRLLVLDQVRRRRRLPSSDDARTLFADGRVLVLPPTPPSVESDFIVHPLLGRTGTT